MSVFAGIARQRCGRTVHQVWPPRQAPPLGQEPHHAPAPKVLCRLSRVGTTLLHPRQDRGQCGRQNLKTGPFPGRSAPTNRRAPAACMRGLCESTPVNPPVFLAAIPFDLRATSGGSNGNHSAQLLLQSPLDRIHAAVEHLDSARQARRSRRSGRPRATAALAARSHGGRTRHRTRRKLFERATAGVDGVGTAVFEIGDLLFVEDRRR